MADANVSEPFVLATYTSTLRGVLDKTLVGAYASVHQRSNKSDKYVTVAAQADAVHILDVSDLHPVISQTLGPSTLFSCPALSFSTSKSGWTTYAVLSSSPELSSLDDAGRTIYMWKFDSSSKEKQQSKTTKTLFTKGHIVHGIFVCDEMKDRIVALSRAGDVSILQAESLGIKSTWPSSSNGPTVQYAWLLSLAPMTLQSRAFMIVIYSGASNTAHLRILAIDEADSISQVKDEAIDLSVEKIISASCNPSGYLSILTTDGIWFLYNILPSLDATEPTPLSKQTKPLRLTNFAWLTSSSSPRPPVTTVSLTSSHVLLATTSSHEIILHIWDLQFGVLLTSYNLPFPTSLSSTSGLHLSLLVDQENLCKPLPKTEIHPTSQVSDQAYLLVSSMPPSRKESSNAQKGKQVTSVVFVVPYIVPRFSTIAAAMGRGTISQRWLQDDQSTIGDKTKEVAEEVANSKLLLALQSALQEGRTQAAEAMFLKWASSVEDKAEETTAFGYNFVRDLLTIVFPLASDPRQGTKSAYPAQIVHHLLHRGVVTSAMLASHGGLLSQLRAHGDWKNVELAFNKVPDLTEMEIVETLRINLEHHSSRPSTSSDAMQVDSPSAQPASTSSSHSSDLMPLETYLHLMMNYPTSRIPLLLSFRRHLRDPEDVTTLLQIFSDWFSKQCIKAVEEECHRLLPGPKDIKKTTEGVWIVVGSQKAKPTQETVPSVEKLTIHISTLLDSCFLSLLSYKPSHAVLRTISSQIVPELAFIHAAQNLRGGLEPFALVQERSLRESLVPKAEKEKQKQKVDWRQRKKGAATGGPGMDVGIYTVEELIL